MWWWCSVLEKGTGEVLCVEHPCTSGMAGGSWTALSECLWSWWAYEPLPVRGSVLPSSKVGMRSEWGRGGILIEGTSLCLVKHFNTRGASQRFQRCPGSWQRCPLPYPESSSRKQTGRRERLQLIFVWIQIAWVEKMVIDSKIFSMVERRNIGR